jgi:acetolactate synthase-1/2/3 large subunit
VGTLRNDTSADLIAETLVRHGVDTIFAVPGEQIDPLFAALADRREQIRVLHTRHEQGAGYMAYGYARATGRPGVYAVVSGPGLLNTTAALATGYAGNAPMLCIAGQVPADMIGRGLGVLHATPDQPAVMRALTKWTTRVERPEDGGRVVAEAIRRARSGRPRPVAVEVPTDVLGGGTDAEPVDPESADPPPAPEPSAVRAAAALLAEAQAPLIVVGGGAVDAGPELRAVAELLQAPVVSHISGRGVLGAEHPLAVTAPVGNRLWADADAVLAVGTRLFQPQTQWGLDELAVVRVDIDPAEINRVRSPAVPIVADAKEALAALAAELERKDVERPSCASRLAALRQQVAAEYGHLQPQLDYLDAIRAELPADGFFVDELTQVGYVARFAFPVLQPRTYVPSTYQGTLGFGFPAALGVKVANPDRAVVCVCGDGGFMYGVQELATAVLHGIGVVTIVFNDGSYGNVERSQQEAFGHAIGTDLHNPDFVQLAELFGAVGARARTPHELRTKLRRALTHRGPTLIEVPVGEMPSPWRFIRLPRVRWDETT